jgi:hypothetical protein
MEYSGASAFLPAPCNKHNPSHLLNKNHGQFLSLYKHIMNVASRLNLPPMVVFILKILPPKILFLGQHSLVAPLKQKKN